MNLIHSLPSRLVSKNLRIKYHAVIISPNVLCTSEVVSLVSDEEHGLRTFEIDLLKGIPGHKREEATRDNKGLHNSCSLRSIIMEINSRRIRWA